MNTTYTVSESVLAPCPAGTGLGLMTTRNTSYLICDIRFPHQDVTLDQSMPAYLSLGVGIGFSVATVLLIGYKYIQQYMTNKIYRKKSHLSDSSDDSLQ